MDARVAEFVAHYERLDDFAIADLFNRRHSLTSDAQAALDLVAQARQLNLSAVRNEMAREQEAIVEAERQREASWKRRDAFWFKVCLWVGIPLLGLGLVFQPERTYQTLVSTIVQVICLVLIAWVVLRIKRAVSGKRKAQP